MCCRQGTYQQQLQNRSTPYTCISQQQVHFAGVFWHGYFRDALNQRFRPYLFRAALG